MSSKYFTSDWTNQVDPHLNIDKPQRTVSFPTHVVEVHFVEKD